ncbi:hypothetical protein [Rhodoferax sp.]|uniref:hypothetical protein n=1 Tax=Rhodoferax sp. TaxID=50421 RepID=UPI002719FF50|nr:hypothetical protein [Rhodoferax sp.]MDO8318793.1 hypothetical protein [Rhodoferax sp.]
MTDRAATSGLFGLGRRLERLLYFGSVLLLLCFFELYFVSAAIYSRAESPDGVAELISKFESNKAHLEELFEAARVVQVEKGNLERDARYSETRRRLGLPEPSIASNQPKASYKGVVSELIAAVSNHSRASIEVAKHLIDAQKSPEEILATLRKHYQDILKKPINVWGIETPLIVPVQYGTAQYQVPTSFIANALLVGLAPLLIAWFGSLYVTRQRELMILRQVRDYKISFPHVLNILPIVLSSFPMFSGNRFKDAKVQSINRAFSRLATGAVRSFILLLFIAPMGLILAYSAIQLVLVRQDLTWMELIVVSSTAICLLCQAIFLVAQEWIILWGKEYYS